MRRPARWVLVMLWLAATAACTYEAPDTPEEQGPTTAEVQAIDDRAAKALNTFAAATAGKSAAEFVPVGEPFGQLGSWETGKPRRSRCSCRPLGHHRVDPGHSRARPNGDSHLGRRVDGHPANAFRA